MLKNTSVIGIYTDRKTVSDAISVLLKARYRPADIAVLSSDNQGSKDFAHEKRTKSLEGAAMGAAAGAVLGSALAWLVSTQIVAITAMAPLVTAGPVLATLAGAGVLWNLRLARRIVCRNAHPRIRRQEVRRADPARRHSPVCALRQ